MTSDEGLRARKQRETRDAIHLAAVRHALADGPEATTIAEISAEANVSARTFFNYYPCKEDAMLGFHGELPTDDELHDFLAESATGDLLLDVLDLIRNVFPSAGTNSELMQQRRALLRSHPQLMQRQMARVVAVEQRIAGVVAIRMRAAADYSYVADIDAASRMLVMLCSSVLRFAIRESAETPPNPPDNSPGSDDSRALESSLSTFREVIRKLQ